VGREFIRESEAVFIRTSGDRASALLCGTGSDRVRDIFMDINGSHALSSGSFDFAGGVVRFAYKFVCDIFK